MSKGIQNRIGQYLHADDAVVRRTVMGTDYIILIAGAYDAYGLIGPEHNGIVVLDDTNKQVVFDQDTPQQSGYFGPSKAQWERLDEIAGLSTKAFLRLTLTHPRSRRAYA